MAYSNTIMSELLKLIPRHQFDTIVKNHGGDRYVKRFTTWNQFTTLLYAQAANKESLREIQQSLEVNDPRLYHLGLPRIKRSTLSDANRSRPSEIFQALFGKLSERCRLLTPKHKFNFDNPLYTWDATLVSLCLSLFPWSKFRQTKGAIKLHFQFNHSGHIPDFLVVAPAFDGETSVAKKNFTLSADSIYCFDRGYCDFVLYRRITDSKAFFVTRTKENQDYNVIGQHSNPLKKGILSDEIITLNNPKYTKPLRLIRYYDQLSGEVFEFLTNNFEFAAFTITKIYQARWQVEAFFKWIKQNLKIKTFLGTNQNAVLTQIWVAMCYFLLLAYIKFQTKFQKSLYYLHRLIQDTLFARLTLIDVLTASQAKLNQFKINEFQFSFL
jgi:Domain of unknown function (DUF4372)/Transposase DDE domain